MGGVLLYSMQVIMKRDRSMVVKLFCAFICALLLITVTPSQSGRKLPADNQTNNSQSGDDEIKLRAEEVLLNVTVTDDFGKQVTNLRRDDFIIAEDMKRQDIAGFQIGKVPVNVVLLLDASGSIVSEINSLRDSAMKFIAGLDAKDKVSIIEFHTTNELLQDWTSDAEELKHAISWRFKPGMVRTSSGTTQYGSTALYDSIFLSAEEQLSKVEGRKAIIILTDGDDTSSKVTFNQALASVIKSGAVVYVISKARQMIEGLGKSGRFFNGEIVARLERAEKLMTEISQRSGGRIYSPIKDEEMKDVYAKVAEELKNQYIITYVPKNDKHDGSLRSVRVFLTRAGYSARTRESYYSLKDK
jgi:Ca-activated chloride channel family protein